MEKTSGSDTRKVRVVAMSAALRKHDVVHVISRAAQRRPVKETARILHLRPRTVEGHRAGTHAPNVATFFAYAQLDPEVRAFAARLLGLDVKNDPVAIEMMRSALKRLEGEHDERDNFESGAAGG